MLYQFYRDYLTQALKNYTPDADPVCSTSEAQPLICSANQLTGFYMMGTLVVKGLKFPINFHFGNFQLGMKSGVLGVMKP